jgi:hypothetical protein
MVKREMPKDGHTPSGYIRHLNPDGSHKTVGEGSHKRSNWLLPVCHTDEERRTFPGVHCITSGDPDFMNAVSEEGSTQTRGRMGTNKSHKNAAGELKRNYGKPMQYDGEMYNG